MIFQISFIRNFIIVKDRGVDFMKKIFNNNFIYFLISIVFMNIYIYFQMKYRIALLDNFIMTLSLSLSINFYNMFLSNFRKDR